jgi:excinuclease Cho
MSVHITSVGLVVTPEPADLFVYPEHIDRASLDALPSQPGIYIFYGEHAEPVYIGKSINIRSRVLSHLRNPNEARMLQQSRYVEFQRTAGEIGALLLESSLIKKLQPIHNKKLRRVREMCSLMLSQDHHYGMPQVVSARDYDFSTTEGLYGLFSSRRSALETLSDIVHQECLCPAVSGLEHAIKGRPCFSRQLRRCKGACIGEESLTDHFQRMESALHEMHVMTWPYEGAVGITEQSDGWTQTHVIDHWHYLGCMDNQSSTNSAGQVNSLQRSGQYEFDVDTYKILIKPLMLGALSVKPVVLDQLNKPARSRRIQQRRLFA